MKSILQLGLFLWAFVAGSAAWASSTQTWKRDGAGWRGGTFEGMAVSPDGQLVPGAAAKILDRPAVPVLWDIAAVGDTLYVGGGDGTGVWRIPASGAAEAIALPKSEPEVFALVAAGSDALYVASGPSGAVYRLDLATRKYEELFRPPAAYIWDIALTADGALLVATGLPGKVWRVDTKKKSAAQPIYETDETHVRCLHVAKSGKIYAGTSGSGWVVELDGSKHGFIVLDSERAEAVAITSSADGILFAAFAGPAKKNAAPAPGARRSDEESDDNSVTVTVSADAPSANNKTEKDDATKGVAAAPRAPELPSGGGSVAKLVVGGEPEAIWSDEKETPLDLEANPSGGVWLAVANEARIWWLDTLGKRGWWDVREETRAVSALGLQAGRLVAATSNPAAVLSYGPGAATPARWTSDVLDAKTRSMLGRLRATTSASSAANVKVQVRAGNTAEPGAGWSEWRDVPGAAGSVGAAGGALGTLPRARYFQVRIEATAKAPAEYGIESLSVNYRGTNRAPLIESVDVQPAGVAYRSIAPPALASGELPVVPAPRGGDAEKAVNETSLAWRSKKVYEAGALTITWQAADPDNDALQYDVESCRVGANGCGEWTALARNVDSSFFSFDGRWLADGIYRFRVTASDAKANFAGEGLSRTSISDDTVIDHQAPAIEAASAQRSADGKVQVRFTAKDGISRISRGDVSSAPGEWVALPSSDGVDDSPEESYSGSVAAPAGNTVEVRAVDVAGNVIVQVVPVK